MLDHPLYRRDPIAPQSLVLELLLAEGDAVVPVAHLLASAALFDISENHIRVTLARLTAAQMVEAPRRGHYQLGPASRNLAADVARWRQAAKRMRSWDGGWVAAYCPTPLPADRTLQRQHARALHLLGFAPWGSSLHIRPDNIEPSLGDLRERMLALGLHSSTSVFRASHFADAEHNALQCLWNGPTLNLGYTTSAEQLTRWMDLSASFPLPQAARESLVLGGAAIRQLIFDPLLPTPLVDENARQHFMDTAVAFDAYGRAIWQRFYASLSTQKTTYPALETTP
jgi:phenylacetic acid degradation operon negative regulatory protein